MEDPPSCDDEHEQRDEVDDKDRGNHPAKRLRDVMTHHRLPPIRIEANKRAIELQALAQWNALTAPQELAGRGEESL
jgi:hypothetical protein